MTAVGFPPVEEELGSSPDVAERAQRPRRRWRLFAMVGFLVTLVLVSLFAPLPHSATAPDPRAVLVAPSADHWFGTDQTGLDIFARTIRAAHLDLLVATGAMAIAVVVGTVLGLLASTRGRAPDIFMRGVDAFQAFPGLILVVAILSLIQGGTLTILAVIGLLSIAPFIRLVRAEGLIVRESGYVEFARVIGVPYRKVMVRHVLRNLSGVILVQASVGTAGAVAALAAISFLGFGVPPPTPTWGTMIESGAADITTGHWWPVVFPAIALTICILLLNRIADDVESWLAKDLT